VEQEVSLGEEDKQKKQNAAPKLPPPAAQVKATASVRILRQRDINDDPRRSQPASALSRTPHFNNRILAESAEAKNEMVGRSLNEMDGREPPLIRRGGERGSWASEPTPRAKNNIATSRRQSALSFVEPLSSSQI